MMSVLVITGFIAASVFTVTTFVLTGINAVDNTLDSFRKTKGDKIIL
jgi:hypothetical protein